MNMSYYDELSVKLRNPEYNENILLRQEAADAIDELTYQLVKLMRNKDNVK